MNLSFTEHLQNQLFNTLKRNKLLGTTKFLWPPSNFVHQAWPNFPPNLFLEWIIIIISYLWGFFKYVPGTMLNGVPHLILKPYKVGIITKETESWS